MESGIRSGKIRVLLISLVMASCSYLQGQVQVKTGTSMIEQKVLKGSTITLEILEYRGALQWQQSVNGTTWLDWQDQTASQVQYLASEEIFIRVSVSSENCDPVYSNTVHFTTYEQPTVNTLDVTNITTTEAQSGGEVTNDGNDPVTARGICWSTVTAPTVAAGHTLNGSGTGSFSSLMTGLTPATTYYVRAYASNSAGTAYGNEVTFTTAGTANLPTVTTATAAVFDFTNANCGGTVTSDGGGTVTARGVCWSTATGPTTVNSKTVDGSGTGTFTSTITGLDYGTRYYVRAYATNSAGTAYGNENTFQSWNEVGPFTDPRDNHAYLWVRIKDQYWLHENLAWLPYVSPSNVGSDTISAHYYVYGYEGADVSAAKATTNFTTYGVLYNWLAAQNACPDGWHLPSDEEWKTLEMNLGMTQADADKEEWRESGAVGRSLKSATGWAENGNGWNTSGFKAFPAGYRAYWGQFTYLTTMALFWTPKENQFEKDKALFRGLTSGNIGVNRSYSYKGGGLSVRCLKD